MHATLLALAGGLLLGSAGEIAAARWAVLHDRDATAATVQRAVRHTLGYSARADGITVDGKRAVVQPRDVRALRGEVRPDAELYAYVTVSGHGPDALNVRVEIEHEDSESAPEVYRRIEPGLFLKVDSTPTPTGDALTFDMTFPGRFVVATEPPPPPPRPTPAPEGDRDQNDKRGLFPDFPDPSDDPAEKADWGLFPEVTDRAIGPTPLILIHGASTDRWDDFRVWAANSDQATAFREAFQVWNFAHDGIGVDAAIGYDRTCLRFDESIVAYLARFLADAESTGVDVNGRRRLFPAGPFAILAHSQGGLKARAFMAHFPAYAERVLAVVSVGAPHMGTPPATPEWLRQTASRIGLLKPTFLEQVADDAFVSHYISLQNQNDLDMGWANFDAAGGFGIPFDAFDAWTRAEGVEPRVVSPRDANRTGARRLAGFESDTTFEPNERLGTYCGEVDLVTPSNRGAMYLDRYFLYGSYIIRGQGWLKLLLEAGQGERSFADNVFENVSLRFTNLVMGLFESPAGGWPLGAYSLGDGFVPLQSQLMLDGLATDHVFETRDLFGWETPVQPLRPNWDVIDNHTLGNPDRIRVLAGWSHLDTVTGRYNRRTGYSPLFAQIADDLLSVVP